MPMRQSIPLISPAEMNFSYFFSLFSVFVLLFFSYFPFINLGLEFTDIGFHLADQDLARHSGLKYVEIFPYWWLSDVIGSWWITTFDAYGLWGARVGGLIALALAGTVAAKLLFQLYKPSLFIVFVLICSGLYRSSDILDYNSVPLVFYMLFSFYFFKLNSEPTKFIYQILSGITFTLLVLSRMPMITTSLVPILCLLISRKMAKDRLQILVRAYLKMFGAICISFLIFALYLQSHGLLNGFLFFQVPSGRHSFSPLILLWLSHLLEKIPFLLALSFITCFITSIIEKKTLPRKTTIFISVCILFLSISAIIFHVSFPEINKTLKFSKLDIFNLYLIMLASNASCLYLLRKSIDFPEIVLYVLAASFPLLRTMGSTSGLQGGLLASSFLYCGITTLWLLRVGKSYSCKTILTCASIALMLLLGGKGIKNFIIRDISILKQTSDISIGRLNGIYTTPERAENIRSLICEIRRHSQKGDHILAFPNIPMIYYATDTLPLGDYTWLFILGYDPLVEKLTQIAQMSPPTFIVKPRIDTKNPEKSHSNFGWPNDAAFMEELHQKTALFDQLIMATWMPKLVWSNDHFDLFRIYPQEEIIK